MISLITRKNGQVEAVVNTMMDIGVSTFINYTQTTKSPTIEGFLQYLTTQHKASVSKRDNTNVLVWDDLMQAHQSFLQQKRIKTLNTLRMLQDQGISAEDITQVLAEL